MVSAMSFSERQVYRCMVNLLDKLNRPLALVIVLVPVLIVNGFLFYRQQQVLKSATADLPYALTEPSAATLPDDSVPTTDSEGDSPDEQEEPGTKEADEEADNPASETKGSLEAQETEAEQAPPPIPYPPIPAQSGNQPTLVAAEDSAALPTPVPASPYPEPGYEE